MWPFAILFFIVEMRQLKAQGLEYLTDVWNAIYCTQEILVLLLLLNSSFGFYFLSLEQITVCASLCAILTWIGIFYWMRLFSTMSAYINLIVETIKDISYFMILLIFCLCAFGNGMYILMEDRTLENPLYDIFGAQYLIAIGEYGPDVFTERTQYRKLVLVLYILSSFVSSVVFFNMLINIMGNTQDRVLMNQERFALVERTRIYSDFMPFVKIDSEFKDKSYMYVCTMLSSEDENDDWSGGIKAIKSQMIRMA